MNAITKMTIIAATFALCGCLPMSDEKATRAVEAVGLTDVSIDGLAILGCADKDTFRSKFTATNSRGERVTGVVCGGVFKGATVRTD